MSSRRSADARSGRISATTRRLDEVSFTRIEMPGPAGIMLSSERPSVYFNWGEGNPVLHLVKYLLLGHGDMPPLTREILRRVEPDQSLRPAVYVGV